MRGFRAIAAAATFIGVSMLGPTGALADGLFAVLLGGNEVSPTGDANAGDKNGYGTASVIFVSSTRLCFSILVDNIDAPILAHIHEESAGKNGLVVVDLVPPNSGDPGTRSGCVDDDAETLAKIRKNPSDFYVNVHNEEFGGGAVRGQLF